MGLPYKVDDLESVPETARELYEEADGGYRLPVEGVETPEDVEPLRNALDRLKEEREELRQKADRVSDEDLEELQRLRKEAKERADKKAKEEGRWEELRTKLQNEHQETVEEMEQTLSRKDRMIEALAVKSQLLSALDAAGVLPEYKDDAYRALMEEDPTVKEVDGEPIGVFPDEIHGDQPISDFVDEWKTTDTAKKYMPPSNKGGGGGSGEEGRKIDSDKPWSEMTMDEKAAYTQKKYGDAA